MIRNKVAAAFFAGVLALLGASSVAWACVYQPRIFGLSAEAGPPGTEVTVSGQGPVGGDVSLRWNGGDGPVLSSATPDQAGTFLARLRIPRVIPGVYFIVTTEGNTSMSRSAFEVTEATATYSPLGGDRWKTIAAVGAPASSHRSVDRPLLVAGVVLVGVALGLFVVAAVRVLPEGVEIGRRCLGLRQP